MKNNKNSTIAQLYKFIYYNNEVSKNDIANELNISLTISSRYVNHLEKKNIIKSFKIGVSSGGRKPILYKINENYKYIIGLSITNSYLYIFLSNLNGDIIGNNLEKIEDYEYSNYIEKIKENIAILLDKYNLSSEEILSIGISVSSITDINNKIIDYSRLLNWKNVNICKDLENYFKIPAFVETDVRVYAYNKLEYNNEKNTSIILYLEKGIGIGLIINNYIVRGYTNRAGDNRFLRKDIHKLIEIINKNEYINFLNNELYFPDQFPHQIIKELIKKYIESINSSSNNKKVFNTFITEVSSMLISLIALLNPKDVILTGNIFNYNDYIFEKIKKYILSYKKFYYTPKIMRFNYYEKPLEKGILNMIVHKGLENSLFGF
ncbi:MAG: hypothetical protein B6I29_00690 [Marinitoga sp. 4572_148]|nr:MAG: hypothetical protein B6I29_00690 [Marinitoga sp. 4572_148]